MKKRFIFVAIIFGLIVIGNLSVPQQWRLGSSLKNPQQIKMFKKIDIETVRSIKERYEWLLFFFVPGVNGAGIGSCDADEKRLCIEVYLERETIAARILIPRSLEGIPVEWEVIGEVFAL